MAVLPDVNRAEIGARPVQPVGTRADRQGRHAELAPLLRRLPILVHAAARHGSVVVLGRRRGLAAGPLVRLAANAKNADNRGRIFAVLALDAPAGVGVDLGGGGLAGRHRGRRRVGCRLVEEAAVVELTVLFRARVAGRGAVRVGVACLGLLPGISAGGEAQTTLPVAVLTTKLVPL